MLFYEFNWLGMLKPFKTIKQMENMEFWKMNMKKV